MALNFSDRELNNLLHIRYALRNPRLHASTLRELSSFYKMDKVKLIKSTINLSGKDDSILSIAHHLYKIVSKCNPEYHRIQITIMDWQLPGQEAKEKLINMLMENYTPIWQVRVEEKNQGFTVVRLTYPGIEWLAFG